MIKQLFIAVIFALLSECGYAQVFAKVNLPKERTVLLASYKGDALTILGKTTVVDGQHFSFSADLFNKSGQFRLIYGDDLGVDFLYDHKPVELEILDTIQSPVFLDKLNADYSNLIELVSEYKTKSALLEPIINGYSRESLFFKQSCKEWKLIQSELNRSIDKLIQRHGNDLLSRLAVLWKVPLVDPEGSQEQRRESLVAHYFDYVEFTDTTLFYTNGYTLKVIEFLMLFTSDKMNQQEAQNAIINGLSKLDKVREGSSQVFGFITDYLIKGFEQFGFEDVLVFLAEHWNQESCLEFGGNGELMEKLWLISKMKVGNRAPQLQTNDLNGRPFNLIDESARFRLVLFWSSDCVHCRQILPVLKSLSDNQKSKEIEIVAFCMDRNRLDCQKFLDDLKVNWINISDFKGYDSPVVKEWGIVGTPTMFLLDSSGTIVEKPQTVDDLKRLFDRF